MIDLASDSDDEESDPGSEDDIEDDITFTPVKIEKVTPSITTRSKTKPKTVAPAPVRGGRSKIALSKDTLPKTTGKRAPKATPKAAPKAIIPSRIRVENPISPAGSDEDISRFTKGARGQPAASGSKAKGKGRAAPAKSDGQSSLGTSLALVRSSIPSLSTASVQRFEGQLVELPPVCFSFCSLILSLIYTFVIASFDLP